jgi:hypothetical protein
LKSGSRQVQPGTFAREGEGASRRKAPSEAEAGEWSIELELEFSINRTT